MQGAVFACCMGLATRVGAVSAISLGLTFVYTWVTYIFAPTNPIQSVVPPFGFALLVFLALFVLGLLALR